MQRQRAYKCRGARRSHVGHKRAHKRVHAHTNIYIQAAMQHINKIVMWHALCGMHTRLHAFTFKFTHTGKHIYHIYP